jgi:hypothetical protein
VCAPLTPSPPHVLLHRDLLLGPAERYPVSACTQPNRIQISACCQASRRNGFPACSPLLWQVKGSMKLVTPCALLGSNL